MPKNVAELRQALAQAVDETKTASDAISEAREAFKKARKALASANDNEKDEAKAAAERASAMVDQACKAYEDAVVDVKDITDDLQRAKDLEKLMASTAVPRDVPEGTTAPAVPANENEEDRKMAPVRRLLADIMETHTKGRVTADVWLRTAYGEARAAYIKQTHQLSDYATGGALSLPDFAETIIAGLENMTVVRRMQPQVLSVSGALLLPTEIGAPDGSWLTENEATTPGEFTFGDIRLDPKRLAIEVVISRKLLDNAARAGAAVRSLEAYIVRRLREKLAVNEDVGFLRGAGTEKVPLGIRHQIAPANVQAISGTTPADIETDLRSRTIRLEEANIVITAGYWIMPPRTAGFLADLRDGVGGNKLFPSIDRDMTLHGYPILKTNQVPKNLGGGGNETEILFGNGPSIIVANGSDAEVRISIEGSYQSGNEHRSLIQRNEMMIHLELDADVKLERATSFSALTGVTY